MDGEISPIKKGVSTQRTGEARSRHKNDTKTLISLITEFADPPATKEPQLTISKGLQEALGEIEKGAQERMEALRAKKKQLQMGKSAEETVPKLIDT